jgi:apolipoprotein N-acyltransferase
VPDLLSVCSGFLVFVPLYWVFLNERGFRAFVYSGLSLMVCYLPAVLYLINIQAPFRQGIYILLTILFLIFLAGAFVGGLVIAWVARELRWAAVLLMPVMLEASYFALVLLSMHTGLISPLSISPASSLIAFPPLIQMASFTGGFGVDFLVLFIASLLAFAVQETALHWPWLRKAAGLKEELKPLPAKHLLAAGGTALAVLLFLGGLFLAGNMEAQKISREQKNSTKTLTVALIQPNINLFTHDILITAKENAALELYRGMIFTAAREQADLIVFPENIWQGNLPAENRFWQRFRGLLGEVKCYSIAGMMTQTDSTHLYNMWYSLGRQGEILATYQKRYLIPFGEYIPNRPLMDRLRQLLNVFLRQNYQLLKLTPMTNPSMDVTPGTEEKIFSQGQARYFVKICDEFTFPQYVREGVRLGGEAVFSPSSGEWFRTPLYLRHYFALACIRAVETRRWIGRTANYANAYFVDAQGCLRSSSPYNERAVLVRKVPLLDYQTFYVRFGNLFAWGCVLLSLASLLWIAGRNIFSRSQKS